MGSFSTGRRKKPTDSRWIIFIRCSAGQRNPQRSVNTSNLWLCGFAQEHVFTREHARALSGRRVIRDHSGSPEGRDPHLWQWTGQLLRKRSKVNWQGCLERERRLCCVKRSVCDIFYIWKACLLVYVKLAAIVGEDIIVCCCNKTKHILL